MSEPMPTTESSLQFDRAEFSEPAAATTCASCNRTISDEYFEVNGKLLCPPCEETVRKSLTGGSGTRRLFRASALGVLAAACGAALYFGISRVTGYNLGIVAIVVGWMVGWAVHRGSEGRGGWGYQVLAVLLTYLAVAMSLAPEVAEGFSRNEPQAASAPSNETQSAGGPEPIQGPVGAIAIGVVSLAAPVFVGIEAPISGLIYGFALWEAWRRNRRLQLNIAGPFKVRAAAGGATEAQVAPLAAEEQRVG